MDDTKANLNRKSLILGGTKIGGTPSWNADDVIRIATLRTGELSHKCVWVSAKVLIGFDQQHVVGKPLPWFPDTFGVGY